MSSDDNQDNCPSLLDTLGFLKFPENKLVDFTDETSILSSQSGGDYNNSKIFTSDSDSENSILKSKSDSNTIESESNSDTSESESDTSENDSNSDTSENESDTSENDSDTIENKSEKSNIMITSVGEFKLKPRSNSETQTNKLLSKLSLKNSKKSKKDSYKVSEHRKIFYKHIL